MYKLLIVDDNPIQIQSVLEFVNWEKFDVNKIRTASNGKEGLEVFEEFSPDIVITDVVMPVMDGIKFTEQARELNNAAKFIFISCYEDFAYLKHAMVNQAITYLLKPIDPAELEKAVAKTLSVIEYERKFNSMTSMLDESFDVFRENFLYRFLYSSYIDKDYLESTLRNLGFSEYRTFAVAKTGFRDAGINNYSLISYAKEFLFDRITGYAITETENRCIFIFMSDTDNCSAFLENIHNALNKFIANIESISQTLPVIGLSHVKKSLYNIRILLTQADTALENCLLSADKNIDIFDDNADLSSNYDIADIKDTLSHLIDTKSRSSIDSFLDEYYPPQLKKMHVKALCITIITTLQLILTERNLNFKDMFGDSFVLWNKLDNFDTIVDTRQWIYNILDKTIELIDNTEKDSYGRLIQEIKNIIDKNYAQISNIDQISEKLFISTSYAKSLFKKYTGITIYDYLLNKRMEIAKQFLSDPSAKVYEAAEMVGYDSKPYFSKIFKRFYGKTPKEYQQSL